MTNQTNKTLLRDRKRWRIKQIDDLDNGQLDEQKCTQKIGILYGPTKKWRIKRIDELNDDELDEFYCITDLDDGNDLDYDTTKEQAAYSCINVNCSFAERQSGDISELRQYMNL